MWKEALPASKFVPLMSSKWLLILLTIVRDGNIMQYGHLRRGPGQPSGLCHLHPCRQEYLHSLRERHVY